MASQSRPLAGRVTPPGSAAIVQTMVGGAGKFLLLAIPFFLLAGELLTEGGLAERLIRFAATLVGHRRAGRPLQRNAANPDVLSRSATRAGQAGTSR